jgi:hypothetical protein
MNDESLPPDLAELERQLESRSAGDASGGFRRRVLQAVGDELAVGRKSAGKMNWRYLAAVAAAVIIGLNLAMIAPSVTDFLEGSHISPGQVVSNYAALKQFDPAMPEDEARRMALLAAAAQGRPRAAIFEMSGMPVQADELFQFRNGDLK